MLVATLELIEQANTIAQATAATLSDGHQGFFIGCDPLLRRNMGQMLGNNWCLHQPEVKPLGAANDSRRQLIVIRCG